MAKTIVRRRGSFPSDSAWQACVDDATALILELCQGEAERAERDERAECIQIARAHQHVIEAFDPPDQIRLATYSNGTCELIARAIRARESQPVAPETCCGCDGPLGAGFFHENCVCLAKMGKPGCKHWVPEPVAPAEPPEVPCVRCKRPVEAVRRCYATPMCYACLPPPPLLSPSPPTETPEPKP